MNSEQIDLLQEILNIENDFGAFIIVYGDTSCVTGGRVYKYEDYQYDAIKLAHQIIKDEIQKAFDVGFEGGKNWGRATA